MPHTAMVSIPFHGHVNRSPELLRALVARGHRVTYANDASLHAGMGGSSEGLFHGTPMIAVPQAADQFANAEQLAALGVARVIDLDTVTTDELRAVLVALPRMRTSPPGAPTSAARCAPRAA
jgi:UDP:flavonoid glycosyltransferase YjiC (YdhE family)